ncbi:gluconeogenesis factor YvcK family protein [Bacillus solimangrovi]|nr:YvcK family protein [Bacillus solimangrovi]
MTKDRIPRVTVIGGGTGLSVLLRGLKKFPIDITAIVTVADDGGSSGRLRDEMDIPPPGDVRNVIAALSEVEPLLEELFQHRFTNGDGLNGHPLGNLFLAAMTSVTGDFVHAIQETSKVLNVKGKVLPAANRSIVLHAEMEDGSIITGESKIPTYNQKIKRVFLSPEHVEPLSETIEAIQCADLIVIGPGSLYTSILPNLLVHHIGDQIQKATAKKVYVCNVMTQAGETVGYSASQHVRVLYDHMKTPFLDYAIVNNEPVSNFILKRYELEESVPVEPDIDKVEALGLHVFSDNFILEQNEMVRHDTDKVANLLYRLLNRQVYHVSDGSRKPTARLRKLGDV